MSAFPETAVAAAAAAAGVGAGDAAGRSARSSRGAVDEGGAGRGFAAAGPRSRRDLASDGVRARERARRGARCASSRGASVAISPPWVKRVGGREGERAARGNAAESDAPVRVIKVLLSKVRRSTPARDKKSQVT